MPATDRARLAQSGRRLSEAGVAPPPSRPDGPLVERLNARFRRAPWSQHWYRWGALADVGILIHVTDGWEQNGAPWAPATDGPGATDMSASLVFAANYVRGKSIPLCAPLSNPNPELLVVAGWLPALTACPLPATQLWRWQEVGGADFQAGCDLRTLWEGRRLGRAMWRVVLEHARRMERSG